MSSETAAPPISFLRLKQIADDACASALGDATYYEHDKTQTWNTTIINNILKALISESTPSTGGNPAYKYAVNSTIIQHLVPTSSLNKAKAAVEPETKSEETKLDATSTDGKPHVGRRGMHSATGAYWNEKSDGMWSFKYDGGDNKGLDVVISVIWIAL